MRLFDVLFAIIIAGISLFLLNPIGYDVFFEYKNENPNIISFISWAIFFSSGILLGRRFYLGKWQITFLILLKAICWGLLGVVVTFMYKFATCGVVLAIATGLIPIIGISMWQDILLSFYNSLFSHICFGFLAYIIFKLIDYYLDYIFSKEKKCSGFINFLQKLPLKSYLLKIIFFIMPLFSIPGFAALMLFFPEFRDLFFIYFLITLGVLLSVFDYRVLNKKL